MGKPGAGIDCQTQIEFRMFFAYSSVFFTASSRTSHGESIYAGLVAQTYQDHVYLTLVG